MQFFTVTLAILVQSCRGYDYPAAGEYQNLYPYGPSDATVPHGDDGSSPAIQIPSLSFFDERYSTLHVNINGDISFGQRYTGFTPSPFPLDVEIPLVAAYFTDLHTDRTSEEEIYYREDTTQEILQRASEDVYTYYGDDYFGFEALWTFIATYHRVSQSSVSPGSPHVTFQIVLISNDDEYFCMFNYGTLGFDKGAPNSVPAQIGLNAGDQLHSLSHPDSMTDAVLDLEGESLMYHIHDLTNECDIPELNLCEDGCKDTDISFFCTCSDPTETLASDGYECIKSFECVGDPHFITTSHDHYRTKLCYDVSGDDGNVLLIARNEKDKLQINGELHLEKTSKHHESFFGSFAIFYGGVKIDVGKNDITINDVDRYTWDDQFTAPLLGDDTASITCRWGTNVKVVLAPDIQLNITRTKMNEGDYYLGIMITNSVGISEDTTGVLGSFLKSSFKAVTTDTASYVEFLDRSLIIPVQKVQRYSAVYKGAVECWHYTVKTQQTHDDLLGDRESYTVPALNYNHF